MGVKIDKDTNLTRTSPEWSISLAQLMQHILLPQESEAAGLWSFFHSLSELPDSTERQEEWAASQTDQEHLIPGKFRFTPAVVCDFLNATEVQ